MKYILLASAVALLSTGAVARDFKGECVNIVANYENSVTQKCEFYDSNTPPALTEKEKKALEKPAEEAKS